MFRLCIRLSIPFKGFQRKLEIYGKPYGEESLKYKREEMQ
ncbi:hypothetical protein phiYS61_43 [Weissella phage phiYS61]|nr:hypothetical protein phiYS61_43 [Weissella phage phiYS61]AFF28001.1 hypothetical protein phiYS61_43 [Weissella phage phiYS61]